MSFPMMGDFSFDVFTPRQILVQVNPTLEQKPFSGEMYGVSAWDGAEEYQAFVAPKIPTPFFVTQDIPHFVLTNPFNFPVIVKAEHDNSSLMLGDDLEAWLSVGDTLELFAEQLEATSLSGQEFYGVVHFTISRADSHDDSGICEYSIVAPESTTDGGPSFEGEEIHFSVAYIGYDAMTNIFNAQSDDERRYEVTLRIISPTSGIVGIVDGIISTTDNTSMIHGMLQASTPSC